MRKAIPEKNNSLLDEPWMVFCSRTRRLLCWVFIGTLVYAAYLTVPESVDFATVISTDLVIEFLMRQPPWIYGSIAIVFLLAGLLKMRMRHRFSTFWHKLTYANGRQLAGMAPR